MRGTWVYRALDLDRNVLYVGHTVDPTERMRAHRRLSAWWQAAIYVRWEGPFPHRTGLAHELALIKRLVPQYNTIGNPSRAVA